MKARKAQHIPTSSSAIARYCAANQLFPKSLADIEHVTHAREREILCNTQTLEWCGQHAFHYLIDNLPLQC